MAHPPEKSAIPQVTAGMDPAIPSPLQSPRDEEVKDLPVEGGKPPETGEDTNAGTAETPPEAQPANVAESVGALEDPIEILVGLAERGEIDPWNINIIEVTDRFLSELERRRELNLKLSGRTLFYAATLLRMKSEQLLVLATPEEGDAEDDSDSSDEDYGGFADGEIESAPARSQEHAAEPDHAL
jgi:hypothetical protein